MGAALDVERFEDEGYLVVEDVLDPITAFGPVLAEYQTALDGVAEGLHAVGALPSTFRDLPFTARLVRIAALTGRTFSQHFDISLPRTGIAVDTPLHLGPAAFGLLRHEHLLDVVEAIVGPEILVNPIHHVRMKLPAKVLGGQDEGLLQSVPWHQDAGVVLPEADETTTLTVWLPLTPATAENGCLQVVPGSHRRGLVEHCPGDAAQGRAGGIPERLVGREGVPVPMRPGSVLLLHRTTVHASLDNLTADEVRISFDLHYHRTDQPTGRPAFPGFVARSRSQPSTELHDAAAWATSWLDTRRRLARDPITGRTSRWSSDTPLCA